MFYDAEFSGCKNISIKLRFFKFSVYLILIKKLLDKTDAFRYLLEFDNCFFC